MKNTIQIIVLILLINSCISDQKQGSTLISGNMPKMSDEWLYLEELEVNKINLVDSVLIDSKGNFELDLEVSEPGFYIFKTQKDNYVLLLIEPDKPITINAFFDLFIPL